MGERKNCICGGTGLTTRLTEVGNTGPEVCTNCYAPAAEVEPLVAALERIATEGIIEGGRILIARDALAALKDA